MRISGRVHFLTRSLIHTAGKQDHEDEAEQEGIEEEERSLSAGSHKGVVTLVAKNASKLPPMDTFTGKADPYMVVSVDGVTQKTAVKSGTLEPVWNESMNFNAVANRSIVRVEMFDSESMGQDRPMGNFSFIVGANPAAVSSTHKLTGLTSDGRPATGSVVMNSAFVRGAKATKTVEQKNEFQLFCDTENYKDAIMAMIFPSRRIEAAFFRVPLPVHEREFQKAVGTLGVPLTGLAIKQYLTYLLVEHSHQVDVYACREFCGFFKRRLDDETSFMYRDIVKLVKERNSGVDNRSLVIGNALNPHHWMLR